MGFFDFIEQDDRVGMTPYLLGELAAFFVADVAWRRADEPRNGVLLHILGHVDTHHGAFVVEQEFGEGASQFGFADAGWAEENERADGALGIAQSGPRAANGVGYPLQGRVLADYALAQTLFHRNQFLDFALEHFRHGNSGPFGDNSGDVLLVHFLFEHAMPFAVHLGGELVELLLCLAQQTVTDLGDALQVAFALFGLLFDLQLLDPLLDLAGPGDEVFLLFPFGLERIGFFADLGPFFVNDRQPFFGIRVVFFLQRLLLDFELRGSAFELVDIGRKGINLDAQRRRSFVNQVDRFVGQEAVGDVAVRQSRRRYDGRILNADAVMHLVTLFQATQNGNRVFHIGLAHENDLETTFKRRIFLDVLAVFVQRGGPDGTQFAASQGRLEHIGSVDRALGRARPDQRVQFVDEQDHLPGGVFNLFQNRFQAVFELAPVLRAGEHGPQIERNYALVL